MSVKLYSTDCPKCKVLKKKLNDEGIEFEECTDVDLMQSLGIMSVPVLEIDGERYSFAQSVTKIKQLNYKR